MAEPYPSALGGMGEPAPAGDPGAYPDAAAAAQGDGRPPTGYGDPLGDSYRPAGDAGGPAPDRSGRPLDDGRPWPAAHTPVGEPAAFGGYSDAGRDPLADGHSGLGAASSRSDGGWPSGGSTDDWGGYRNGAGEAGGASDHGEPRRPDPALDRPYTGSADAWNPAPSGERAGDPLGGPAPAADGSPGRGGDDAPHAGVYRVPTGEQPAAFSSGGSGTAAGYPGWGPGAPDRADAEPPGVPTYPGAGTAEHDPLDPLADYRSDAPSGAPGAGHWDTPRDSAGTPGPDPLAADTAWPRAEDRGPSAGDADPLGRPSGGPEPAYPGFDPLDGPYRVPEAPERADADPLGGPTYRGAGAAEHDTRGPLGDRRPDPLDPLADYRSDPLSGSPGAGHWDTRREAAGTPGPDPLAADTAWPPSTGGLDTDRADAERRYDDPLGAEPWDGGHRPPTGGAPADELGAPRDWRDPAPVGAGSPGGPAADRAADPLTDPFEPAGGRAGTESRPEPPAAEQPTLGGDLGTGSGNTWAFSRDDPRLPEEVRRIGAEAQDRRRDGNPTHTTQALRPEDLRGDGPVPPVTGEDWHADPHHPDPGEGTQAMPVLSDDLLGGEPHERGDRRDEDAGFARGREADGYGEPGRGDEDRGYGDGVDDRYGDRGHDGRGYGDRTDDRYGDRGHDGRGYGDRTDDRYGERGYDDRYDDRADDRYGERGYDDRYDDRADYRDEPDYPDYPESGGYDEADGTARPGPRGRRGRGGRDRVADEFPGFDDRPLGGSAGEEYPGYDNIDDWPETAPRAGATLWLGILGLVPVLGLCTAIAALVLAPGVRRAIRSSNGQLEGEHLVRGGVVTAWIGIALSVLEIVIGGVSLLF
ncbi:DUF4190 domain-containing protein [Marinitenerispora sediminis]|nr:DUF4190 domain-containing protein [Marinitenerispora sediminis]